MPANDLHLTKPPVAQKGMLIRKPVAEVFCAFADPAVTTKFWFTKSTGKMTKGAKLRWEWEMFGASVDVAVKDFQENSRIVFAWGPESAPSTVELRFVPWKNEGTFVQMTETGFSGSGDDQVARAIDSTGGFALVLAAVKALLEHNVALTVVLDHAPPKGLQL